MFSIWRNSDAVGDAKMEATMATEFVMVPVPADRMREVYALLAGMPAGASAGAAASAIGQPAALHGGWTARMIERAYQESPDPMKRFLDFLASNAGRVVSSDETAKAVGYSPQQQAGMLGAFGHRTRSRYQLETWFFEATYGASGLAQYRMGAEEAGALHG